MALRVKVLQGHGWGVWTLYWVTCMGKASSQSFAVGRNQLTLGRALPCWRTARPWDVKALIQKLENMIDEIEFFFKMRLDYIFQQLPCSPNKYESSFHDTEYWSISFLNDYIGPSCMYNNLVNHYAIYEFVSFFQFFMIINNMVMEILIYFLCGCIVL